MMAEKQLPELAQNSRGDVIFHAAGGIVNASSTLAAVAWLIVNWTTIRPSPVFILAAFCVGILVGDLITGILHWAFDTWFSADTKFLRRMVLIVREHHIYPDRVFQYSFYHDAGALSVMAFLLTSPLFTYAFVQSAGDSPGFHLLYYAVCVAVTVSFALVFMFEFHKFGHRRDSRQVVRLLQRLGLLLSYAHHMKHHSGKHDRNYCLINGHADRTFGAAGGWRALESIISRLTGATPRSDDREWLQAFQRSAGE